MARSEIIKSCPRHGTYMIAHKFERWETRRPVDGFKCANLVYIDGNAEGFYTLQASGELTPYAGT